MPSQLRRDELLRDLSHVKQMVESVPDASSTVRLMWQSRQSAIETELASLQEGSGGPASVALIFEGGPVIGTRDIRADFSAKVLGEYQHFVSAVFADQIAERLHRKGPLPHSSRSRLYVREIARGSVGFILEEAPTDQGDMLDTSLKLAVTRASEIVQGLSAASLADFERQLEPLRPRIVAAVRNLARTLAEFGAETKIVDDDSSVSVPNVEARTLHERLREVVVIEREEIRAGVLTGILPDRLSFEFRADDAEEDLYGAVTEEMATQYALGAGAIVNRHGLAEFTMFETLRGGRLVQQQRVLSSFTSDDGDQAQ